MPRKKYDLIVIGAGSGLDVAVAAAEHLDWEVALIEKGPLGGTCLNRGCIPSKMVIHAADVAETIRQAGRFGIQAKITAVDFAAITGRASNHVDAESAAMEDNLRENKVLDLYRETAFFTGPSTLRAGNKELRGERILIAAGARPRVPSITGIEKVDYWTSTEALRQTRQPRSLIIIGGGYISAELGHFYGALGTEVTIVQHSARLLRQEDVDISKEFTRVFARKYNVLLNHSAKSVRQEQDGTKIVVAEDDQGDRKTLKAEALLIAAGLQSNADLLQVENAGVKTDERGFIKVDEFLATSAENVWALGDIIGRAQFKHAANREAQHVFWNMAGEHRHAMDYSVMPRAIFTSPQIAAVGLREQDAKAMEIEYQALHLDYMETGMGIAMEAEDAFVKFLIDPTQSKILGCHIMGPDASTLIHEVVVVMTAVEGNAAGITVPIHVHPSLSEVIQRAL
ncbi:MAG: dihydrolipoyl dehydrogenase [Deltaproteobacteria bacterium]